MGIDVKRMEMWFLTHSEARQEIYRHKKTGRLYGVICNADKVGDRELQIVYRDMETGERWVRPASEFNDGRFELWQPVNSGD